MDELNQKPTEEMLKEARRLAFFADEVLSQEILQSKAKLQAYIDRHTDHSLTEISHEDLIEAVDKAKLFPEPMEVLRKRTLRCYSWISFKACFLPAFLFALLSWYFLTTPMEDWVWNVGQYNDAILEFFPRAQTWVNISIVYREKMIVLFICFTVTFIFAVLYLLLLIIKNWQILTVEFVPLKKHTCKDNGALMFFGIIMSLFIILFFPSNIYFGGSETFLTSIVDDKIIYILASEYSIWNTFFGFILWCSLTILFSVRGLLAVFLIISSGQYCHKINKFKFENNYSVVTLDVHKNKWFKKK